MLQRDGHDETEVNQIVQEALRIGHVDDLLGGPRGRRGCKRPKLADSVKVRSLLLAWRVILGQGQNAWATRGDERFQTEMRNIKRLGAVGLARDRPKSQHEEENHGGR